MSRYKPREAKNEVSESLNSTETTLKNFHLVLSTLGEFLPELQNGEDRISCAFLKSPWEMNGKRQRRRVPRWENDPSIREERKKKRVKNRNHMLP